MSADQRLQEDKRKLTRGGLLAWWLIVCVASMAVGVAVAVATGWNVYLWWGIAYVVLWMVRMVAWMRTGALA